jgi:ABC-2 type transport system permease protein
MTTLAYTVNDSTTMFRRNLRRLQRYPSMTLLLVGMPIVFLLLFVYVFGGQLSHGLGAANAGGHTGRAGYLNYVTPGVLLMTIAAAVQGTAIVVAMDMTSGIIDRFRTMAIARSAVLTGHVLAALVQTFVSLGIVLGVALALGSAPPRARWNGSRRSACSRSSRSRSSGSPPPSASPRKASRPRATRRCS